MTLTWYAQELFSSCVAACVRMVLNGLGDGRDEAQVRQLIGHARTGVSLMAAQARLAQARAVAEWHADWNLTDLRAAVRAGHFPIVGVERHPLGYQRAFHAVVLVQITSATVERSTHSTAQRRVVMASWLSPRLGNWRAARFC